MKQKNIDTLFQAQLHSYASPMDTDAFYDKLVRRNKGGAIWQKSWLLILLFLVGFAGALTAYKFSMPEDVRTASLAADNVDQEIKKLSTIAANTAAMTSDIAEASPTLATNEAAIDALPENGTQPISSNTKKQTNNPLSGQASKRSVSTHNVSVPKPDKASSSSSLPVSIQTSLKKVESQSLEKIDNKLPILQPQRLPTASPIDKQTYIEPVPSADYNRSRIQWGVDIQGGYSWASRDFSLTDAESSTNLIMRSGSEEILETVQLAVLGRATLESGLYARLGAGYTRITERFEASGSSITVDTLNVIQEIIISPTGDTTIVRGDMPVTTTSSFTKRTHNYHHLIDVPLIVGYTIGDGESPLTLQIEAGAIMNLSLRSTGEIWGDGPQVIDVEEEEVFEKNVGVSYYGALHLRYALNDQLGVYLGPYYRYMPSSFTKAAYGIDQKYQLLGLNAGVQIGL